MKILNIAAGKMKPLYFPGDEKTQGSHRIVNVDTSYFAHVSPSIVESEIEERIPLIVNGREWYCNCDIFEFMDRIKITFDRVVIYRFLEHVTFTQVNYFIYLISTVLKEGGIVDIIVPNYITLAEMISTEDIEADPYFEASNILLTTELLNEPSCPHASIWTPKRAKYFFELEGRFTVSNDEIYPQFSFDGRDIYLRFLARRI
jgi:hypothetical protein